MSAVYLAVLYLLVKSEMIMLVALFSKTRLTKWLLRGFDNITSTFLFHFAKGAALGVLACLLSLNLYNLSLSIIRFIAASDPDDEDAFCGFQYYIFETILMGFFIFYAVMIHKLYNCLSSKRDLMEGLARSSA